MMDSDSAGTSSCSTIPPPQPSVITRAVKKRKKSAPREMSSNHKTLNSDTEPSDDERPLVSARRVSSTAYPVIQAPNRANPPKTGGTSAPELTAPFGPAVATLVPLTTPSVEFSPAGPPIGPLTSSGPSSLRSSGGTFLTPGDSPPAVVKRGRGRPRKYPKEAEFKYPKRPRGRPRKNAVVGDSIKGICSAFIEHSAVLTHQLAAKNMPQVLAHLHKGIALAQYLQENLSDEGDLEPSQREYIEAYTRDKAL